MKDLLLEALEHIKPSDLDYQDWLSIGMALKAEHYDVSVWDNWSRSDERYHSKACQEKWATFDSDGVTGATIMFFAKKAGYNPRPYEGDGDIPFDGEIEWDGNNYKDVRARTILLLLYETGLRRSELVGLDDADVDFAASQLKVTGKRNKQRIVPFGTELADALTQYKAIRDGQQTKRCGALFLNDKGERMTGMQVYSIVHKYLTAVTSLKKRSPHVLRHTFATAMLNNGAGLESIKNLLGHESVSTTEIYAHTTFEQLKRVYKEAHPRA